LNSFLLGRGTYLVVLDVVEGEDEGKILDTHPPQKILHIFRFDSRQTGLLTAGTITMGPPTTTFGRNAARGLAVSFIISHHGFIQHVFGLALPPSQPARSYRNTDASREGRRAFLRQGLALVTTTLVVSSAEALAPQPAGASEASPSAEILSKPLSTDTPPLGSSEALLASSNAVSATAPVVAQVDWSAVFAKAGKKALGGGKAGASAAVVQVLSLMWLRTTMNYQYRYGGNLSTALGTLWEQGGVARLYQGLPFALLQGPLTRFGDTAANVGILALLESFTDVPLPAKTACASVAAGVWRIVLMPVDASKTAMQVEGKDGLGRLWQRVGESGPGVLYRGAAAQVAATAVGHFPWFVTYNFLNEALPLVSDGDSNAALLSLVRSAGMGLTASCVSDTVSNSLRVIKTTAQTAQLSVEKELSYPEVVALIVERDGVAGLFGRGLQTRLLTNAIQGALFSVLWKYFQQTGGT
jgi:Mitochondrial carrier protein